MNNQIDVKAQMSGGLSVALPDGSPLSLVVVDNTGRVVAGGRALADALFDAVVGAYENYWAGNGHLAAINRIEYHEGEMKCSTN